MSRKDRTPNYSKADTVYVLFQVGYISEKRDRNSNCCAHEMKMTGVAWSNCLFLFLFFAFLLYTRQ